MASWCVQENIRRNFGMPQPNGYRKAMRFMRHADKFGLPIITIVDTPGAYAGKAAEELGQVSSAGCGTCAVSVCELACAWVQPVHVMWTGRDV
jgi:acetyl-CoA carboxylase alpha subunit